MLNLFGVVVLQLWSIAGEGLEIYGQLSGGGTSAQSIHAFCYKLNLFSVVEFHRPMVNWRRGVLVHVLSAICETYLV